MGHLHGPETENEGGVSVNKDTLRISCQPLKGQTVGPNTNLLLLQEILYFCSAAVYKATRLFEMNVKQFYTWHNNIIHYILIISEVTVGCCSMSKPRSPTLRLLLLLNAFIL